MTSGVNKIAYIGALPCHCWFWLPSSDVQVVQQAMFIPVFTMETILIMVVIPIAGALHGEPAIAADVELGVRIYKAGLTFILL